MKRLQAELDRQRRGILCCPQLRGELEKVRAENTQLRLERETMRAELLAERALRLGDDRRARDVEALKAEHARVAAELERCERAPLPPTNYGTRSRLPCPMQLNPVPGESNGRVKEAEEAGTPDLGGVVAI